MLFWRWIGSILLEVDFCRRVRRSPGSVQLSSNATLSLQLPGQARVNSKQCTLPASWQSLGCDLTSTSEKRTGMLKSTAFEARLRPQLRTMGLVGRLQGKTRHAVATVRIFEKCGGDDQACCDMLQKMWWSACARVVPCRRKTRLGSQHSVLMCAHCIQNLRPRPQPQ